jgi:hypothetical protein
LTRSRPRLGLRLHLLLPQFAELLLSALDRLALGGVETGFRLGAF